MLKIRSVVAIVAIVLLVATPQLSISVSPGESFFFTYGGMGDERFTISLYAGISDSKQYISIASSDSEYSLNGSDVYVVYINNNGLFNAGMTYDLGGDEYAYAAVFNYNSNTTYIVGETKKPGGDSDGFIMALDRSLVPLWVYIVDQGDNERLMDLALDDRGNLIIVGTTNNYSLDDYGDTIVMNISSMGGVNWAYILYTVYPTDARGVEIIPGSSNFTIVGTRFIETDLTQGYITFIRGGGSINIMWDASLFINQSNTTSIELHDVAFNPVDGLLYAIGTIYGHTGLTDRDIYLHAYSPENPSIAGKAFLINGSDDAVHIAFSKNHMTLLGTGTVTALGKGLEDQFLLNISTINSSYDFLTLGTNETDIGTWVEPVEAELPGILMSGETLGVPVGGGVEAYTAFINETDKHGVVFPPINKTLMMHNVASEIYHPAVSFNGYNYTPIGVIERGINYTSINLGWEVEPIPETWMVMFVPLVAAFTIAGIYLWLRRGSR